MAALVAERSRRRRAWRLWRGCGGRRGGVGSREEEEEGVLALTAVWRRVRDKEKGLAALAARRRAQRQGARPWAVKTPSAPSSDPPSAPPRGPRSAQTTALAVGSLVRCMLGVELGAIILSVKQFF